MQIVRDCGMMLNMPGLDRLVARKAPGRPPRLDGEHQKAYAATIEGEPIPAVHRVVCRPIVDLCQWFLEEFRVLVSMQTLDRKLRNMS